MDTDLLERRLALVEQQITDTERQIARRRDILGRLEVEGLGASETADITRDLLREIDDTLRAWTAERKRLQAELRREGAMATTVDSPSRR